MLIKYYSNNNKDHEKYHTAKFIGKKVNLGLSTVRLALNFLGFFYFSLLRADVGQQACSTIPG